ncbi:hypothetical protein AVEN_174062-2-1, partial [Araneus ventricosus]
DFIYHLIMDLEDGLNASKKTYSPRCMKSVCDYRLPQLIE